MTKDIKPYVNKLVNLTILHKKINSSVGNKVIKEKIDELSKSGVSMTMNLVNYLRKISYKWNEDEINKRHNELAEIAYNKVWTIE